MKNLVLTIIIIFLFTCSLAGEDYFSLILKAEEQYNSNNYKIAGELYEEAFEIGPENSNLNYYLIAASAYALDGNNDSAFELLNKLLERGWIEPGEIMLMSDFENLHNDERWSEIVQKIQTIECGYNKSLKEHLEVIFDEDQKWRTLMSENNYDMNSPDMKELVEKVKVSDENNLKEIVTIIDEYGWPGKNLVGIKGSSAVFLVIQHADLETQEKYFPLLLEAAEKGEAKWADVALMKDRILMYKGEKQVYGTQLIYNENLGEWELYPVETMDEVDNRRLEAGLLPIKEYLKLFGID